MIIVKNNMAISATKHHLHFLMKSLKATQQTNGAPSHRCKPEDDLLQSCDTGEVTAVQEKIKYFLCRFRIIVGNLEGVPHSDSRHSEDVT